MRIDLDKNKINIFVAFAKKNKAIGLNNDLPWKRALKADFAFLNLLTTKHKTAVIMGRKTYESIGKPLSKRLNIVLTSKSIENVTCFKSLASAINYCKEKEYYIAIFGGVNVFKEALQLEHKLFCTIIENEFEGDAFFPENTESLIDITVEVNEVLKQNNIKITWELKKDRFYENNIAYGFYVNE